MRCPVCKTECGSSNACHECGFSEVGKVFVNQEDAAQWVSAVVVPHRDNYNKAKILPPVDWLEVIKQNPQAKRLFEFSIPVSLKRRSNLEMLKNLDDADYDTYLLDAILGHIAIVSKSDVIREHFLDVVNDTYLTTTNFRRTNSRAVERASDLAAILTNLQPGAVLVFEIGSKIKKDVVKVFTTALRDFGLDIIIGKGPGAPSIHLDLPPFTTIFVAETISDIPTEIAETLDAVIEFNPGQEELDELQIREAAPFYGIQLTKANVDVIKESLSQETFKNAKSILKFISDYLYLHTEIQQPLSENAMRKIINELS